MTLEIMLGTVGAATVLVIGAVIWSHRQQQAVIEQLEGRLAHLTAAISLLTDTAEGGFRDVAVEVGRLAGASEGPRPRSRAVTQRRITTAARRGRTVEDIAAAEQVSEGEVRLRLQLAEPGKDAHAALR